MQTKQECSATSRQSTKPAMAYRRANHLDCSSKKRLWLFSG